MTDFSELMDVFSIPRPAGSKAERQVLASVTAWLEQKGIPYRLQPFRLYPYFFILTGLWLIFSRSLLALAFSLRWGEPTFTIAILSLAGGLLDVAFNLPIITWPGAVNGSNLIIEFKPEAPQQELILSAHYDSKTELLDHHQRSFFVKNLPLGILLTVLVGVLGSLDRSLMDQGSAWAPVVYILGLLLSLVLLFLAWGVGLNLSLGRLRKHPSQGAVDNGTACAILLGLAERMHQGEPTLKTTHLTLALFDGEEVNMQGSRAYVRQREWCLPARAVNLEIMAQDGDYVYWEQDGTSLRLVPTSAEVNQLIAQAVLEVTGSIAHPVGPVNSDGYSFLQAGIPASTLGTYSTIWQDRGFHLPSDNLERVVMRRLPEAVAILENIISQVDQHSLK
ncbi:MAG: M28 family peptidase [Anaerolineales bacterium]|nr:M28 family peptidase [Anaerolineales bacterium]